MLVLSRKLGEKIVIDGDIQLEVLEATGNRVRLGILAPDDCRIARAERLRAEAPLHEPPQTALSGDMGRLRNSMRTPRASVLPLSHNLPLAPKSGSLPVRG